MKESFERYWTHFCSITQTKWSDQHKSLAFLFFTNGMVEGSTQTSQRINHVIQSFRCGSETLS